MTPFIVLINGPPGAGKDTLADHLLTVLPGAQKRRMSHELKVRTHRLYDCPREAWDDPDFYEAVKNDPHEHFHGLAPRRAYIEVSESYFKPLHGKRFFGELLAEWIERRRPATTFSVVVPDSGFDHEAAPVMERFGADRCMLLRVHADARGCSFDGDSRSFIELPGVATCDLWNDVLGDTAEFLRAGEAAVRMRLAGLAGMEEEVAAEKQAVFEAARRAWAERRRRAEATAEGPQ